DTGLVERPVGPAGVPALLAPVRGAVTDEDDRVGLGGLLAHRQRGRCGPPPGVRQRLRGVSRRSSARRRTAPMNDTTMSPMAPSPSTGRFGASHDRRMPPTIAPASPTAVSARQPKPPPATTRPASAPA